MPHSSAHFTYPGSRIKSCKHKPLYLMPIVALGTLLFNDLISVLSISITDWDLLMSSLFTSQPSRLETTERTYFRLLLKRKTCIVCELFTPRVLLTLGLEIFLILLWLKDDSSSNWGLLFCLFLLLHVPYSKSSSDVTMAILSCLCSKIRGIFYLVYSYLKFTKFAFNGELIP